MKYTCYNKRTWHNAWGRQTLKKKTPKEEILRNWFSPAHGITWRSIRWPHLCEYIIKKLFHTPFLRILKIAGMIPISAANGKQGIHHHRLHHPPGSIGRASVPSSAHGSLLMPWPFPRSSPPFPIPVAWTASSCSCTVKLSYLLVRGSPRLVLPRCCFLFWKCDQFSAISCVLLMVLCFPCRSFSAAVRC